MQIRVATPEDIPRLEQLEQAVIELSVLSTLPLKQTMHTTMIYQPY